MNHLERKQALASARTAERLAVLYGTRDGMVERQQERYAHLLDRFSETFGERDTVLLMSAPGRTEIGGNHTDHNHGQVLAAAVNLDTLAAVSPRGDKKVSLHSEGYPAIEVDLGVLDPQAGEEGTTAALIRGVACRMAELGYQIGGFDAVMTSSVASGSGLSSSAAFEVLMVAIQDRLYNGSVIDFKTRAKISQYAENVHFGKPSGLMDQMASSAGGLVHIDFAPADPTVDALNYSFSDKGYALVVVATGASHADLTPAYAAIPDEMKQVASAMGGKLLADVDEEAFMAALPGLYHKVPDRALLRAFHFFEENRRVAAQVSALKADNVDAFLSEINASGISSWTLLQNVYAYAEEQGLCLAQAIAKAHPACTATRVHGGGFAGTTLNFVRSEGLSSFIAVMESVFGKGSCHVLDIRPEGAAEVVL